MSTGTFQQRHPTLVWSNPEAGTEVWIRAALVQPRFHTLLDACLEFGLARVRGEWENLERESAPETRRAAADVNRILRHIEEGFADAEAGH